MGDIMKETIVKEYCDRCKKEIGQTLIYHTFDDQHLHIKFQKIKFSAIPKRWKKDAKIDTRYYTETEQYLVLCQECAKEFVEWWEGGNN